MKSTKHIMQTLTYLRESISELKNRDDIDYTFEQMRILQEAKKILEELENTGIVDFT